MIESEDGGRIRFPGAVKSVQQKRNVPKLLPNGFSLCGDSPDFLQKLVGVTPDIGRRQLPVGQLANVDIPPLSGRLDLGRAGVGQGLQTFLQLLAPLQECLDFLTFLCHFHTSSVFSSLQASCIF